MDLIAQKALELVPFLNYPNFDEIKEDLLLSDASINAFLLSMELKRLCAPSIRIIDFRSDGDCVEFIYSGIRHFLQAADIEEFKQLLEQYHGVYSNGLYEELLRHHAERKKNKQQEAPTPNQEANIPARFKVDSIRFASYSHRRDERMFYCSQILVTLANGRKFEAKTSDLSCSGIKLILPFVMPFTGRENITITFTGLIELFPKYAELLTEVPYETLGVETKDTKVWLKTRYLAENKDFEQFVLNFQEANRYRYRIDTNYFAYTLNIKAMEYAYLPKVRGITIFFSTDPQTPEPSFTLKSDCNHDDLDYWRDERSDDKLRALFSAQRMKRFTESLNNNETVSTTFYCFKHTSQNHVYFICATLEELLEKNLTDTFFRMAASHTSFRVYKFEFAPLDHSANCIKNIISDLPNENTELITKEISALGYIGMLTRIDTPEDLEVYSNFTATTSANALQCFTLKTDSVKPINLEYLQYTKPREEPRYLYKTPVLVYGKDLPPVTGWTRDLSSRGLQIELAAPVEYYNNDVIYVSLPKLQELSKKTKLENIPYDVVFVNSAHTILHLRMHHKTSNESTSLFLEELFKINAKHLEPARAVPEMSMLSQALRNITIANLFSTPVIFMRGSLNRLGFICESKYGTEVNNLCQIYEHEPQKRNTFPLFANSILKNEVMPSFKLIKNTEKQFQINIYVKRTKINDVVTYFPRAEDEFTYKQEIVDFIKDGQVHGYFAAFALFLSITGRPNTTEIDKELAYLKRAAPHKFKALESNLWNKFGFGDLVDITQSVALKNGLTSFIPTSVPDEHLPA